MTVTETQPSNLGGKPEDATYKGDVLPGGRLALALAGFQADLPKIAKAQSATVPTKAGGSYSYSYADLSDVSERVLPLLAKQGLAFTALPTISGNLFVLRYQLLHDSGEALGGEYPLGDPKASAQAIGSAITYARRYCLCAVTGVSPDDDDDAAATHTQKVGEFPEQPSELSQAKDRVLAAWNFQYGAFNKAEAEETYRTWSNGGALGSADPAGLRKFAAYLSTLPTTEAGGNPADTQQQDRPVEELSEKQRGMIFALFEDLGLKNDPAAQREYLGRVLERPIGSRSDVKAADADAVIESLKADVAEVRRTGEMPKTGDVAADVGPRMIGRGDLRALAGLFTQLGIADTAERLHIAASLVGRTPVDKETGKPSATGLTAAEGKALLAPDGLAGCKSRDDVEALIVQAEAARAGGES